MGKTMLEMGTLRQRTREVVERVSDAELAPHPSSAPFQLIPGKGLSHIESRSPYHTPGMHTQMTSQERV